MIFSKDDLVEWLENVTEMIASIPDPMKARTHNCADCWAVLRYTFGRHCNKWLERHPREGCQPNGRWQVKEPPPLPEPIPVEAVKLPGQVDADPIEPPVGAACAPTGEQEELF